MSHGQPTSANSGTGEPFSTQAAAQRKAKAVPPTITVQSVAMRNGRYENR